MKVEYVISLFIFLNSTWWPVNIVSALASVKSFNSTFPFFWKGLEAHKYKNTLDCVMRIIRYEGLKA